VEKGHKKITPFFIPYAITNMGGALVAIDQGFMGPNYSISTACATANYAFVAAANHIRNGDADVMLAGGAEAPIIPVGLGGFVACRALSTRCDEPHRASRPWDHGRDGFVMGEGAGVLVMESLEHALARGAPILAEYLGGALTCDAHHMTDPHPDGLGVSTCIELALRDGGVDRDAVNYINAHATSTLVGDKAEVRVFFFVWVFFLGGGGGGGGRGVEAPSPAHAPSSSKALLRSRSTAPPPPPSGCLTHSRCTPLVILPVLPSADPRPAQGVHRRHVGRQDERHQVDDRPRAGRGGRAGGGGHHPGHPHWLGAPHPQPREQRRAHRGGRGVSRGALRAAAARAPPCVEAGKAQRVSLVLCQAPPCARLLTRLRHCSQISILVFCFECAQEDPIEEVGDIDVVPNVKAQLDINVGISNSFGFGGHNSVVAFAAYKP
jgi:hypothetical protein